MSLKDRLQDGSAVYGVVGLGYVGLPLAVEMAREGHRVIGIDVSAEKVTEVCAGRSYIQDVPGDDVATLVEAGTLSATTDFSAVAGCDVVVICVPTPLDKMREPDVSYIVAATQALAPHLHADMLVTLESTTYPGTTDEIVRPIVEAQGLRAGIDVFVAFSPERVDPGNPVYLTKNTPKVVGGVTPACTEVAAAFYSTFLDHVVPVSTARAAEMTKLLENIFRCVNIALVNELLMLCERMDIDIWEVVDAAKTKPFGFMPFYPGPGLGGHCIPVDPFYLSWKAREFGFHTEFIEISGKVNENMGHYVVQRLMSALNTRRKSLAGSRILVLGVAYKSDVDDMRESPAIKIIDLMIEADAEVVYHDPYVTRYSQDGHDVDSVELTEEEIRRADTVLILTAHSGVDYGLVARTANLVLDTRNALKEFGSDNIVRL